MDYDFSLVDRAKYASAKFALNFIVDGMKIGLGTGSTANWFVVLLADFVRTKGIKVSTVATSNFTERLARFVGMDVFGLDEMVKLDLTVDGADEFDEKLNLIKGGGGALLHEKLVASASSEMIVITDESKYVDKLGKFPLPVEIVPFGAQSTKNMLAELLYSFGYVNFSGAIRKQDNDIFITNEGNNIFDYNLKKIDDVEELSLKINNLPGVVDNGLFVNLCSKVIVAKSNGEIVLHSMAGRVSDFQVLDFNEMHSLNKLILGINNEI